MRSLLIAGLAALWNRDQLNSDHLDWLRALPQGPVTIPELPGLQFVHGAPDDMKSDPAGNAGPRIACGVIVKK